jgi:outer membrane autotransporter protein
VLNPDGPRNPVAIARGLDRVVGAGADPSAFFPIYNLPAGSIVAGINQLGGEVHTALGGLGFNFTNQFLAAMLNQQDALRARLGGDPLAFAPHRALAPASALAAADLAAGAAAAAAPRTAAWATGFGQQARIEGEAAIGSARRTERSWGIAAGVDVSAGRGLTVGAAVSGGSAEATLANNLGSMSAEVGQAGLYALGRFGGLSIGAAVAYTLLEADTHRAIPVLGETGLTSSFRAHGPSGRIEAAFEAARFASFTVSPVGAIEAHSLTAPAIRESAAPGGTGAAALVVEGRTLTTARTELGLRADVAGVFGFGAANAYARLAWAHYLARDAAIEASLTGLPAARFAILGAQPDRDTALLSLGLDVRITPAITLGGRFDAELGSDTTRLGGFARVRVEF